MDWYKLAKCNIVLYQGLKSKSDQSNFWTEDLATADYYANGPSGVVRKVEVPQELAFQHLREVGMLPGPSPYSDVYVLTDDELRGYDVKFVSEHDRLMAWKELGMLADRPNYSKDIQEEYRYHITVAWGKMVDYDGVERKENYIQKEYKPHDVFSLSDSVDVIEGEAIFMFGWDFLDVYVSKDPIVLVQPQNMQRVIHSAERVYIPIGKHPSFYFSAPYGDEIDKSSPFNDRKKLFDGNQAVNIIVNIHKVNV